MSIWLPKALVKANLAKNIEEAKDFIIKGKVKLDDVVSVDDTLILVAGDTVIVNGVEKPETIKLSVDDININYIVPKNKTKKA